MSIISVEGNLGAGKSTLLGMLNSQVIKEPVDEWENTAGNNILQKYYNDPKRWAFTFQLNALHSRSRLWEEAIKKNGQEQKILFSERSPMADRYIFGEIMQREGNFQEAEYAIYDSLCRSIMNNLPVKGLIYLRCSPELCLERIKKRNRKGEEGITLEYIKKVHERHEAWISRQKEECPVLVVDTEFYDVEKTSDLEEVLKLIKSFMQKIEGKEEEKQQEEGGALEVEPNCEIEEEKCQEKEKVSSSEQEIEQSSSSEEFDSNNFNIFEWLA